MLDKNPVLDGSEIISKLKQLQCTEIAVANRSAPHGRCRMFSAGLWDKNPHSVRSCSAHQAIRKAGRFVQALPVLIWSSTVLLAAFALAGCSASAAGSAESQSLPPAREAAIDESARTFMRTVAHDVTQDGPLAWLKFFDNGPGFFMAVNGQ